MITKAKAGNITAINLVIKLNSGYQKRADDIDEKEARLRGEYDGALPNEMLNAMDAFERNVMLAQMYYACNKWMRQVLACIPTSQSKKTGKGAQNSERKIKELQEDLEQIFYREFCTNLNVPYYASAERIIRQENDALADKANKTSQEENVLALNTSRFKIYDAFMRTPIPCLTEQTSDQHVDFLGAQEQGAQGCVPQSTQLINSSVVQIIKQTKEQVKFMAHVRELGTADFHSAPEVQRAHQWLLNLTKGPIYKSLGQNDKGQVMFTLKQLAAQKDRLEEQECSQKTKQGLDDVSAGRADIPVEDIAKDYREEPLDAVAFLTQPKKDVEKDIWEQRFSIAKEYDAEKARRLVKEFKNRSPKELYEFWQYLMKKGMTSWENVRIMNHLDPIVTRNERKKKRR